MLLGLLSFCLLRLSFGFFRLIFELLGFLQLFLKGCQLLIGSNQLVGGLAHVGRWPHARVSFDPRPAFVHPLEPSQYFSEHAPRWPAFSSTLRCSVQQCLRFAQLRPLFFFHHPVAGNKSWLSPQA